MMLTLSCSSEETFKAQYFLHAHLDYDKEKEEVVKEDMRWLEERLAIENSVELYNHDTYKPKVTVGNGRVDVRWLIRGEFGESLELQDFPFDTQVRAPTRATQAKQLFCSLSQTISKEASNY
eukprot:g6797.t1